jgi:class 3 adenylate cyclase
MELFIALIDQLNSSGADERRSIAERIAATFEKECAVLALDMTGYSSSVRRDGIVPHLCRIRRLQLLARPIIERCGGEIVRQLADNLLAIFPTAACAVEAAFTLRDAAAKISENEEADRVDGLNVSIGIDHGKLLLVPGHDCFGDPVNVAFKLGEDVAGSGEILVTENVWAQLDTSREPHGAPLKISISGIDLVAYKLNGPMLPR